MKGSTPCRTLPQENRTIHGVPRGGKSVPASYYRIQDYRTLNIQERGRRTPYQFFTNPLIERVFRDFSRVKMYLTRASPDF